MCDMCEGLGPTEADLRAQVVRTIENFGWLVQLVDADEQRPALAYTVGLTGFGLPEIYAEGLDLYLAGRLLNQAAELCVAGQSGEGSRIFGHDGREYVLDAAAAEDLYVALDLYGSSVRALRLKEQPK